MRAIFFTLFVTCFSLANTMAQTKPVTLTGTLVMQTGETFPYKVVLTDSGNVVKGYSLTYKEPDETKTMIRGTLDRRMRTLAFKEKDIVYSHSVSTKAFMCLVNAKLEYVHGSNGYILKGPVTSRETDNTSCTPGEIIFDNEQEVQNLFAYHEQFDTVITMHKKVKEPLAEQAAQDLEQLITDNVTAGDERSYEWHSDTLVIAVWDGGNVDGDRITLQYNGKDQLTNYYLVKEKRVLRIPITDYDVNTITILAINEGSDPPNTASVLLTDGTTKYSILAYNKKGDAAVIKVKRVKG